MSAVIYWLAGILTLLGLYLGLRVAVMAYLKFRGKRVVTCPEIREPAAVEVDAKHASLTALLGKPGLRLENCSRWPERQRCGEECLKQIEAAPGDCLVGNMIRKWYEGKPCALCGKMFDEVDWLDYKPALKPPGPKSETIEWQAVPPERIPRLLATYQPVCWSCHIAAGFRRQFPELVVDRPWHHPG